MARTTRNRLWTTAIGIIGDMPTYEFTCDKCKHRFEVLVRSERQKIACAKCGGKKVTKQYAVFGLNLGAPEERGMSGPLCSCGQGGCAICSAKV